MYVCAKGPLVNNGYDVLLNDVNSMIKLCSFCGNENHPVASGYRKTTIVVFKINYLK